MSPRIVTGKWRTSTHSRYRASSFHHCTFHKLMPPFTQPTPARFTTLTLAPPFMQRLCACFATHALMPPFTQHPRSFCDSCPRVSIHAARAHTSIHAACPHPHLHSPVLPVPMPVFTQPMPTFPPPFTLHTQPRRHISNRFLMFFFVPSYITRLCSF